LPSLKQIFLGFEAIHVRKYSENRKKDTTSGSNPVKPEIEFAILSTFNCDEEVKRQEVEGLH
jgi:hypothetical protein